MDAIFDEISGSQKWNRRTHVSPFLSDAAVLDSNIEDTVALAAKTRLPAIFPWRSYVAAGGLLSYAANLKDLYARLATTVDRILRGARPAEPPVEQPTVFKLVVNLKTAKAVGFDLPLAIITRADGVIE
jgi:putative ABC transport system substrate-binding protein